MIDPTSQVPFWANILIYMEMYQWYLLAAILPTIYLVIVRLFGFPLLQRFNQEVVFIFPTKAKFGKISNQDQPYFQFKNGIYWSANPLTNVNSSHKFNTMKGDKSGKCLEIVPDANGERVLCGMSRKQHKLIENRIDYNPNQLHIFTQAINQSVYDMERRKTKLDELIHGEHKIRSIPKHDVWLMKNFLQHFHRHWEIVIDPNGQFYQLNPVKKRQRFSVSLWHTIGVTMQKIIDVQEEKPVEEGSSSNTKQQLVLQQVTNQTVISQLKYVTEYQNYSANAAFRLCKKMKRVETNFYYWASGSINMLPIIVLIGAMACVGLVFYALHGSSPTLGPMPK